MKKKQNKVVWVILVISLCFNIFFAWGYISSRYFMKRIKTREGRTELIVKRLELSVEQQEVFEQLQAQLQIQKARVKLNYQKDINIFWQEIIKDKPDSLIIKQSLEQATRGREEYMIIASTQIHDFLQVLSPKQQQAYIKFLRRNKVISN